MSWVKAQEGWRLDVFREGDPAELPLRLEVHRANDRWIVCLLSGGSGRVAAGRYETAEEARRAAVVQARALLGLDLEPASA